MNAHKKPTLINYILPSVLILLGLWHFHRHGMGAGVIIPITLGGFTLYMAMFNHALLHQVEALVIKLWFPISQAITAVLLTVTFYLVFAPVGLILRLLNKDILNRRFNTSPETYWIKRSSKENNYTQQF